MVPVCSAVGGHFSELRKRGKDFYHIYASKPGGAGAPYIAPLKLPVLLLSQDLIHHCGGFSSLTDVLPLLARRAEQDQPAACVLFAPSLFSRHTFYNPSRDQPSWMWGPGCCPWPCVLFLCPQAWGRSVDLTSQWWGRSSNRQAIIAGAQANAYSLQGNLSSPA